MRRRVAKHMQRALTPDQVRELRASRAVYDALTEERAHILARLRAINAARPAYSHASLGRLYGVSPRTVEAISTFRHYKEVR